MLDVLVRGTRETACCRCYSQLGASLQVLDAALQLQGAPSCCACSASRHCVSRHALCFCAATQVLGLELQFEGAPLRLERKQAYLARKIAERKAKKLGTSAEVGGAAQEHSLQSRAAAQQQSSAAAKQHRTRIYTSCWTVSCCGHADVEGLHRCC